MGHVRDLPKKTLGVDIEDGFRPRYQVLPTRRQVVSALRKTVKGAEAVYLAPDPDREGESIAWHLREALKLPKTRCRRVTFNEITRRAVQRAFESPREINMDLVDAQQARRILDRIMGYQLSPLLWKKVARGLSAGRVQSVAVRLIVEREKEIRAFEPEEYWSITARLTPGDEAQAFAAALLEVDGEKIRIPDEETAQGILSRLEGQDWRVAKVETKRTRVVARPPFATSQLQQAASVRLGFRPRKTMLLAQQLYEGGIEVGDEGGVGLITYMRTDSFRIANEALDACRDFIRDQLGEKQLSPKPRHYRSRHGAQEAHEAIRPTDVTRTPEALAPYLNRDQLRLYTLIWQRFVASQMAPAEYDVTNATVEAGPAVFRAKGRVVVTEGHTAVYTALRPRGARDEQILPPLEAGMDLACLDVTPAQHFTKPPPRYTEASLVKTLEREGIGRPSTYAQIIATIQERGYCEVKDKSFYAKELGIVTNDALLPFFDNIINTRFTAQLEEHLDNIEEAKANWRDVLQEFYEPFTADLAKAETEMPSVKKQLAEETDVTCPACGSPMIMRLSRRGKFLACSAFPKCRHTQPVDEEGNPVEVETLDEKCPECGNALTVRTGRRGQFVGCSGYPECRYTRPLDAKPDEERPARKPAEATGEKCPKCGAALVIRTGRRGKFVGCSAFPKCRHTAPLEGDEAPAEEKVDEKCDECGSPMVVRTGRRGRFLACTAYPKCKNTKSVGDSGPAPAPPKEAGRDCPDCGKPMVIRSSRRGQFLGCSGYPKCRHTENLADESTEENED
jgi:DNA topoisomerase-1